MKLVHNNGLKIWPQIRAFFYTKLTNSTYFVCQELDDEGDERLSGRVWASIWMNTVYFQNTFVFSCLRMPVVISTSLLSSLPPFVALHQWEMTAWSSQAWGRGAVCVWPTSSLVGVTKGGEFSAAFSPCYNQPKIWHEAWMSTWLQSVKCFHGGRKLHLIPWISEKSSETWYHGVQHG